VPLCVDKYDQWGAQLTDRYYYEKKFDECRGVIQPEMALPMGIPGAFGLPVRFPSSSSVSLLPLPSPLSPSVHRFKRIRVEGEDER